MSIKIALAGNPNSGKTTLFDPAHLVAQGVPLRRPQRVDRAPSRRRHGAGGSRAVAAALQG